MPEDVTEKEVTVDAAGKVTEESEPVAVTTDETDKEDTAATTENVAAVPSMPEHEETPVTAEEKEDSPENIETVDATETAEKPSRPITTEDFSHLDFAADMSTTSGKRKVFERNMAAIRTVKRLEDEEREATPEELKVLKSFSIFW